MDNPETHTTYTRHRTKTISTVRDNRRRKPIMDNPKTHTTYTRHRTRTINKR